VIRVNDSRRLSKG